MLSRCMPGQKGMGQAAFPKKNKKPRLAAGLGFVAHSFAIAEERLHQSRGLTPDPNYFLPLSAEEGACFTTEMS